jgi:hypothetical protein
MTANKKATSHTKKHPTLGQRLLGWLRRHKLDVAVLAMIVVLCGTISAVNMTGYPQRFEDEGTYISQAWAIKDQGALTHYTYWYDHPPVGWIQMAGHLATTDALDRYGSAIAAGREFMLLLHLLTIVLLFALARRLGMGTIAASLGTLLYGLSPLSVEFSRYVLLDNVALPWVLGSFFLALNPRKHILAAMGAALCMAIAILSKETFVVLLPVLLYAVLQNSDKRNRRFVLATFGVVFVTVCGFYALYAVLKNELIPGKGHVSLMGTLVWQVFGREGSGSILSANSGARGLVGYWLDIDTWLLALGTVTLPIAFFFKQLRAVALALLVGLVLMLRNGYLPYPYVIMLLPFAALVFAGVVHYLIIKRAKFTGSHMKGLPARTAVLAIAVGLGVFVAPTWYNKLDAITNKDLDASSRQAVQWVNENVTRDQRLVVESALWTDLEDIGFSNPQPVWLYKTETDPEIKSEIDGWDGIDYVILNGPTLGGQNFDKTFPTVDKAIDNAKLVKEFGTDNQKILIYEVKN